MLGHQTESIDVVKMDIENAEWAAVPQMVDSGQFNGVKQLMMEYHVVSGSRANLLKKVQAIQAMEKIGFKRYYVHKNTACRQKVKGFPVVRTSCYEVHYIRR
jgi:glutaredoxin-related protein